MSGKYSKRWRWFLRWRRYGWDGKKAPIRGLDGALGKIGFAISFEYSGVFHNGSHWFTSWVFRDWDDYQDDQEKELDRNYEQYLRERGEI